MALGVITLGGRDVDHHGYVYITLSGYTMNWLLYIGGWYVTGSLLEQIYACLMVSSKSKINRTVGLIIFEIAWTAVWIWICWRFVS